MGRRMISAILCPRQLITAFSHGAGSKYTRANSLHPRLEATASGWAAGVVADSEDIASASSSKAQAALRSLLRTFGQPGFRFVLERLVENEPPSPSVVKS